MCQDGGQPAGHSQTDLHLQIRSHYSNKNLQHFFEVAWCFPGDLEGKESACNAGDLGLIPGSGRSPGGGNTTPSSILAWRIPWTEEPGGLQSLGLQRVRQD